MIFRYRPIDRERKYSNVGADTPGFTLDHLKGAAFEYRETIRYHHDELEPEIINKMQIILDQIESDLRFILERYFKSDQ